MKTRYLSLVCVLAGFIFGSTHTNGQSLTGMPTVVDTSRRELVRVIYNQLIEPALVVTQAWSGSYSNGNPGSNNPAFDQATLRTLNTIRSIAGLTGNLSNSSPTHNAKCQEAAFMMGYRGEVSHFPQSWWTFYTEGGAEAAEHSQLAYLHNGPDGILALMQDGGGINSAVGHRQALLSSSAVQVGLGNVAPVSTNYHQVGVVWVINTNSSGPSRDGFIAWPSKGYFPYQLVPARWSIRIPNADLTFTSVNVSRNGSPVSLSDVQVYGDLMVWVESGVSTTPFTQTIPRPTNDSQVTVELDNVLTQSGWTNIVYTVTVFDPQTAGPDTVTPGAIPTPTTNIVDTSNGLTSTVVPFATGYEARVGKTIPLALTEGDADHGMTNLSSFTTGRYPVVVTDDPDSSLDGSSWFHLASSDFGNQYLNVEREIIPSTNSVLSFWSLLGYSTTSQVATVQISTDGGKGWKDIWSQQGIPNVTEYDYSLRAISLASYAGKTLKIRFAYLYTPYGGSAYIYTNTWVGWRFDQVTVSGAKEFIEEHQSVTAGPNGSFTPVTTGEHAVQTRAKLFGSDLSPQAPVAGWTDWSPAVFVTVGDGGVVRLHQPEWSGGEVTFTFPAKGGSNYRIDCTTNLVDWNTVTNLVGADDVIRITDSTSGGKCFYRVVKTSP